MLIIDALEGDEMGSSWHEGAEEEGAVDRPGDAREAEDSERVAGEGRGREKLGEEGELG